MPGIEAVVGYAVGTLQVLFTDWWRRVTKHKRDLRLLQAELRRLRTFERQFGLTPGVPPESEAIPIPPVPTDLFTRTVGETEWRLTDEFADDNSQQSMLHLLDGCNQLKHYFDEINEYIALARTADTEEKRELRERVEALAGAYDNVLDRVLFHVDGGIGDMERRLELTTFGTQLGRTFDGLPPGSNPEPVNSSNDPRVKEWKRKNRRD